MAHRPQRILLGAFGDPGHAFPMIALGRELVARGHEVCLQSWERWQQYAEGEGLHFAAAPEYHTEPAWPADFGFYEAAEMATRETVPLVRDFRPEVVVADILTLGPSLAAQIEGVPWATLIPHVLPTEAPGLPIFSFGAQLPRTALGRAFWDAVKGPVRVGVETGRRDLNTVRARFGLPPLDRPHGGISTDLAMVATFPQLEYPRQWPSHVHVVGPLIWEPPAEPVPIPPGEDPLVLVAPSTSQDPGHRLLRAALTGLDGAPVRVLATWNRRVPHRPLPSAANATVVEWLSYAQTMAQSDVVVCHAGHGTLVRALTLGCPAVACPVAGDMNENAARLSWSGAGVRLPRRFLTPRAVRLAVERVLNDSAMGAKAGELAAWAERNHAAARAADLLEGMVERHALPARGAA